MAVNGIEIEVGQIWRRRDGYSVYVESRDAHQEWPWNLKVPSWASGDEWSVGCDGRVYPEGSESAGDLVELISPAAKEPAADCWHNWGGGDNPVPGAVVQCVLREGELELRKADELDWGVIGSLGDIVKYRVVPAAKQGLPVQFAEPESANATQVGGDHYKAKASQPWDYIVSNEMGFLAGNVVKYVTRYRDKNGVEDLKKARHYLDKLIETEGGAQ